MACELDTFKICLVVAAELDIVAMCELYPITRLDGSRVTCSVLLLLKLNLETFDVDGITLF